ncbi:hypothetical protein [Microbacterium terrisoli]|uniref:hypothetical protein n=1 Tax=Microbacterium terrisoli TaxID=3242192 RepID=UPI00280607F2|nr:hypothetical protein [Microbacterium protaetiae]
MATSTTPPDMQDSPAPAPTSTRDNGGALVNMVGPGALDRIRREARERAYPNSETERRYINAVDRAVFDRVSGLEKHMVAAAEHELAANTKHLEAADGVFDDLLALRTRLDRGFEDPQALATEYRKLLGRARDVQRKLASAARSAAFYGERVDDPYAAADHVMAMLPVSSYIPIDPSRYL